MKTNKSSSPVHPFVKWAGGKGQLLNDIQGLYPAGLGSTLDRYCEPFVGGGAVLFDILSRFEMKEVFINDINSELINSYVQIKENVNFLIEKLENLANEFLPASQEERKVIFYEKRERFNELKVAENGNPLEKASLFLFLNKTCFNGLYRVNKKGLYNVPMGSYKKPLICDPENLLAINKLLKNVTIHCGDYRLCKGFINKNTFVYLDPPYRPLSTTASFTEYSEVAFGDEEQLALGKFVDSLHKKGAKIVISNSDPKNTDENDHFFDQLYSGYTIKRITARRVINCNAGSRGSIRELLIHND